MAMCDTVKVASDDFAGGFVIINASDFDPSIHQLFVEAPPEGPTPADVARFRRIRTPKFKEAGDGSDNG